MFDHAKDRVSLCCPGQTREVENCIVRVSARVINVIPPDQRFVNFANIAQERGEQSTGDEMLRNVCRDINDFAKVDAGPGFAEMLQKSNESIVRSIVRADGEEIEVSAIY